MIKIKHFLETIEEDDGQRIWVESHGLTRDLREWCEVDHVLPHLGPTVKLNEWYEKHPDAYDYFAEKYHQALDKSPYRAALRDLAQASADENFTLLYAGEDPAHNTATAMYEYLMELQFSPPEP
jgi:uncharacterized protein YeaO (DUF488 family)